MNPCVAAKRIANSLHSQHLGALRGVTLVSDAGVAVVFGNDDYARDPKTREEVRLILDRAAEKGIEVLGFETDDAGHSAWAMALRCTNLEWLRAIVREASYQSHCPDGQGRRIVVAEVIQSPDLSASADDVVQVDRVASVVETFDEDALVVEGEDRSF